MGLGPGGTTSGGVDDLWERENEKEKEDCEKEKEKEKERSLKGRRISS